MRVTGKKSLASFLSGALGVAWYALFPILGGLLVAIVAVAVSHGQPSGELQVNAEFLRLTFPAAKAAGQRPLLLGTLCLILVDLGAAQLVVYHLRRLFANVRAEKPFAVQNSGHIRAVGLAVIGGSVLSALVCLATGFIAMRVIDVPGVELSPRAGNPVAGIVLGLAILVLAEVFRRGAELQEDHDLTV